MVSKSTITCGFPRNPRLLSFTFLNIWWPELGVPPHSWTTLFGSVASQYCLAMGGSRWFFFGASACWCRCFSQSEYITSYWWDLSQTFHLILPLILPNNSWRDRNHPGNSTAVLGVSRWDTPGLELEPDWRTTTWSCAKSTSKLCKGSTKLALILETSTADLMHGTGLRKAFINPSLDAAAWLYKLLVGWH